MLVVWKLDRRGRNLAHLVNIVQELSDRGNPKPAPPDGLGVGFRPLPQTTRYWPTSITGLDTTSPARPGTPRLHRNQTPEPAPAAADGCRKFNSHRSAPSRTSAAIVRRDFGVKAPGCDEVVGTPGRGGRGGVGRRGNPSAAAVQFSIVADLTPVPALPVIGAIAPALLLLLVVGARRRTAS